MEIKKLSSPKIIKIGYKKIKCPNCKNKSSDPYTPFCSKKCSDQDLLKWLSDENYVNLDI